MVGRVVANTEFWRALVRYGSFDRLRFFVGEGGDVAGLEAQLVDTGILPRERLEVQNLLALPEALAAGELDVLHLSAVSAAFVDLVWLRDRHARRPLPVTAQIHSLSYPRFLGDYLRAAAAPAGCGGRHHLLEQRRARRRTGLPRQRRRRAGAAGRPARPPPALPLPIIPLGVDVDRLTGGDRRAHPPAPGPARRTPAWCWAWAASPNTTRWTSSRCCRRSAGPASASAPRRRGRYLLLAGARQGTKTPEMVQLWAKLLGIADRVRLEVDFPDEEKPHLLAAADLFVSPSDNLQETFGLSVVEAHGGGLPVVMSDFDGYKDTVDEEVGVRVPARFAAPLDRVSELSGLLYERPLHLFLGQAMEIDLPALETALARAVRRSGRRARGWARPAPRGRGALRLAGGDRRLRGALARAGAQAPAAAARRRRTRPPLAMDFEQHLRQLSHRQVPADRVVVRTPLARSAGARAQPVPDLPRAAERVRRRGRAGAAGAGGAADDPGGAGPAADAAARPTLPAVATGARDRVAAEARPARLKRCRP